MSWKIDITKIPTFEKFDEYRGRDILTDNEMEKLKTYWIEKNRYYWDIITFLSNTGLRFPSEIEKKTYLERY